MRGLPVGVCHRWEQVPSSRARVLPGPTARDRPPCVPVSQLPCGPRAPRAPRVCFCFMPLSLWPPRLFDLSHHHSLAYKCSRWALRWALASGETGTQPQPQGALSLTQEVGTQLHSPSSGVERTLQTGHPHRGLINPVRRIVAD